MLKKKKPRLITYNLDSILPCVANTHFRKPGYMVWNLSSISQHLGLQAGEFLNFISEECLALALAWKLYLVTIISILTHYKVMFSWKHTFINKSNCALCFHIFYISPRMANRQNRECTKQGMVFETLQGTLSSAFVCVCWGDGWDTIKPVQQVSTPKVKWKIYWIDFVHQILYMCMLFQGY